MNTGHDDVRHVEHGSMPHVDDGEEIERFERFPSVTAVGHRHEIARLGDAAANAIRLTRERPVPDGCGFGPFCSNTSAADTCLHRSSSHWP